MFTEESQLMSEEAKKERETEYGSWVAASCFVDVPLHTEVKERLDKETDQSRLVVAGFISKGTYEACLGQLQDGLHTCQAEPLELI